MLLGLTCPVVVGVVLVFILALGLLDGDLGFVFQAQAAGGDHLIAFLQAGENLHAHALAHAGDDAALVSDGIVSDHHHLLAALVGIEQRRRRHDDGVLNGLGDDRYAHGSAGLQLFAGIGDLHPDFDGGGVGIDGGADHGDLAGEVAVGSGDARGAADADGGGFFHGNVGARH